MENPFKTIEEKLDKLQFSVDELQLNKTSIDRIDSDILGVKEASKLLGLAEGSLYNMAINGKIPSYKEFGKRYFFKSELLDWIKQSKHKTVQNIAHEVNQTLSEQKPKPKLEQMADKIGQHNKKRGQRSGKPQSTPSKEQGKDKGNDVKIS